MSLKDKIVEELGTVTDPGTSMDVMSVGLVKEICATPEGDVCLKLSPSSPACPVVFHLAFEIKERIKKISEVRTLEITVIDYQRADELNELLRD
jgi:metal-sulfur cluster biosynthetic enzyme